MIGMIEGRNILVIEIGDGDVSVSSQNPDCEDNYVHIAFRNTKKGMGKKIGDSLTEDDEDKEDPPICLVALNRESFEVFLHSVEKAKAHADKIWGKIQKARRKGKR